MQKVERVDLNPPVYRFREFFIENLRKSRHKVFLSWSEKTRC